MTELTLQRASVTKQGSPLLADIDVCFRPGELTALLGPNGAGKTTLLRCALGLERLSAGDALMDGTAVERLAPAWRARRVAYLPQSRPLAWPVRVRDVVALGRFAHGARLGRLGELDAAAVARALTACDLDALADRRTDTLSGGELARVHCARAFAGETPLLLADEPVAALDPRHQFQVLDIVRGFVDRGNGAVVVLHDPALAARFADRLVWIKRGRLVADGTPLETLTETRLAEVYGVEARIHRSDGAPAIAVRGTL